LNEFLKQSNTHLKTLFKCLQCYDCQIGQQESLQQRTKISEAEDAAAVSDDNDLDVVGGPVVANLAVAAALVEAVKVHPQSLPATTWAFRFTMSLFPEAGRMQKICMGLASTSGFDNVQKRN
jgi:hypothetical protein